jgi:hypothetical protein
MHCMGTERECAFRMGNGPGCQHVDACVAPSLVRAVSARAAGVIRHPRLSIDACRTRDGVTLIRRSMLDPCRVVTRTL